MKIKIKGISTTLKDSLFHIYSEKYTSLPKPLVATALFSIPQFHFYSDNHKMESQNLQPFWSMVSFTQRNACGIDLCYCLFPQVSSFLLLSSSPQMYIYIHINLVNIYILCYIVYILHIQLCIYCMCNVYFQFLVIMN